MVQNMSPSKEALTAAQVKTEELKQRKLESEAVKNEAEAKRTEQETVDKALRSKIDKAKAISDQETMAPARSAAQEQPRVREDHERQMSVPIDQENQNEQPPVQETPDQQRSIFDQVRGRRSEPELSEEGVPATIFAVRFSKDEDRNLTEILEKKGIPPSNKNKNLYAYLNPGTTQTMDYIKLQIDPENRKAIAAARNEPLDPEDDDGLGLPRNDVSKNLQEALDGLESERPQPPGVRTPGRSPQFDQKGNPVPPGSIPPALDANGNPIPPGSIPPGSIPPALDANGNPIPTQLLTPEGAVIPPEYQEAPEGSSVERVDIKGQWDSRDKGQLSQTQGSQQELRDYSKDFKSLGEGYTKRVGALYNTYEKNLETLNKQRVQLYNSQTKAFTTYNESAAQLVNLAAESNERQLANIERYEKNLQKVQELKEEHISNPPSYKKAIADINNEAHIFLFLGAIFSAIGGDKDPLKTLNQIIDKNYKDQVLAYNQKLDFFKSEENLYKRLYDTSEAKESVKMNFVNTKLGIAEKTLSNMINLGKIQSDQIGSAQKFLTDITNLRVKQEGMVYEIGAKHLELQSQNEAKRLLAEQNRLSKIQDRRLKEQELFLKTLSLQSQNARDYNTAQLGRERLEFDKSKDKNKYSWEHFKLIHETEEKREERKLAQFNKDRIYELKQRQTLTSEQAQELKQREYDQKVWEDNEDRLERANKEQYKRWLDGQNISQEQREFNWKQIVDKEKLSQGERQLNINEKKAEAKAKGEDRAMFVIPSETEGGKDLIINARDKKQANKISEKMGQGRADILRINKYISEQEKNFKGVSGSLKRFTISAVEGNWLELGPTTYGAYKGGKLGAKKGFGGKFRVPRISKGGAIGRGAGGIAGAAAGYVGTKALKAGSKFLPFMVTWEQTKREILGYMGTLRIPMVGGGQFSDREAGIVLEALGASFDEKGGVTIDNEVLFTAMRENGFVDNMRKLRDSMLRSQLLQIQASGDIETKKLLNTAEGLKKVAMSKFGFSAEDATRAIQPILTGEASIVYKDNP